MVKFAILTAASEVVLWRGGEVELCAAKHRECLVTVPMTWHWLTAFGDLRSTSLPAISVTKKNS